MSKSNQGEKSKKRNDIIFIIALVCTVSIIGLSFFLLQGEGSSVTVTVSGELYATYSLESDIAVTIESGEDHVNLLVIKDGYAFVESATCPDGICAAHRPISREGESIVCLPHRVVITVHSENHEDEPDIIA